MTRTTPEGKIKDAIDKALKRLTLVYRFMPVPTGYGIRTLDYLLCINGAFVAIEAKAPGKDLTGYQADVRKQIEAAGGLVFRIRDEDELTEFIEVAKKLGAETIN